MSSESELVVRTHVARDLLQNAALFKTDKLVVWEYVSNGLQYVDVGTNPIVRVTLDGKGKRILIVDNGRGMDLAGLSNFFVMHGENIDRKAGHVGRGRFGTGKSAAFGIADTLRITTVRNGKRSKVELTRADIDAMKSEERIPVRVLESEAATEEGNGTRLEIDGVRLRSFDQAGIIKYIERHLARWPKNVRVVVNNHECEYTDPPVAEERRYKPEGALREMLGDVQLVIRVSKVPLDDDLRGVSIYSQGVWHETTLAGLDGKEMVQYLFGEVDVPALEDDDSPIPPFDLTRSMRLNRENPLVQAVYGFVGANLDALRRELAEKDKQRKALEDQKKLAKEASEIARVINEDFEEFRKKLAKAKAAAPGGGDLGPIGRGGDTDEGDVLPGAELPGRKTSDTGQPGGNGGHGGGGGEPPTAKPSVEADESSKTKTARPAGTTGKAARPRGGFDVEFAHQGGESHRALYSAEKRIIYVNLDHPQLAAALEAANVEEPVFRRLAYEVAFAEYAIALAQELANRDEYIDPSDPIVDIRETMNRVARRGAKLYSS